MKWSRRQLFVGAGATIALAGLGTAAAVASGTGDSAAPDGPKPVDVRAFARQPVQKTAPKAPLAGPLKGKELPIEKYLPRHSNMLRVAQAEAVLQIKCMADYGVTYEPPNPATFSLAQNSDNDANIERRYGVIDASDARVRGYALPGGPGGSAPESRKLTDDQRLVLKNFDPTTGKARAASFHGKALPKGGCRLQAANQMGDLRSKTAEQINGDTFSQSREHATVAALSRKRDACLTSKGYSPSSGKGVASEALPKEQAVAEADCSTKVGIADQWFSIESQMQSDSIAKNKAALDAEKTQNDEILRKAEAVLSKA